jgi:hypothetical protein
LVLHDGVRFGHCRLESAVYLEQLGFACLAQRLKSTQWFNPCEPIFRVEPK